MTSALVYASTQNELTSNDQLANFSKTLLGTYKFTTGTVAQNNAALQNLNKILSQTQIKRACCNNTSNVNVRIPLPTGETLATGGNSALMQEFEYYDKEISVPINTPGFCTIDGVNYAPNTPDCDDFYNVYCLNIVNEFTNGNGGVFNADSFTNYKPECACYLPEPSWLAKALSGAPTPKCFYPGCATGVAYMDPVSRNENCDLTICNQSVNIGSAAVSQDSSLIVNLQAQCGAQGKNPIVIVPETESTPSEITNTSGGVNVPPPAVPSTTPTTAPSSSNMYLYIGICCCVVIIIGIILFFYFKSRG